MRITLAMQNETAIANLNQKQESINSLSAAISSGKRLARPSDDPSGWSQSLDLKEGLRDYDSILQNIDFAIGWNNVTESALSQISDLISQARQTGLQAGGGNSAVSTNALVQTLDGLLSQAVSVSGAEYEGRYVFSGLQSSAPFTRDQTTGVITANPAGGDVRIRQDRLGSNFLKVNLTADEVFTFTDSGGATVSVFDEIKALRDAVQANDGTLIDQKLTTLDEAFDHIGQQLTLTGTKLAGLDGQKSALSLVKTDNQSRLADIEDTDLPEAITRLQQTQTAFEAALQVTAMLDKLNLTDYLR